MRGRLAGSARVGGVLGGGEGAVGGSWGQATVRQRASRESAVHSAEPAVYGCSCDATKCSSHGHLRPPTGRAFAHEPLPPAPSWHRPHLLISLIPCPPASRPFPRFHSFYEDVMMNYRGERKDGEGRSTGWPALDLFYKVLAAAGGGRAGAGVV